MSNSRQALKMLHPVTTVLTSAIGWSKGNHIYLQFEGIMQYILIASRELLIKYITFPIHHTYGVNLITSIRAVSGWWVTTSQDPVLTARHRDRTELTQFYDCRGSRSLNWTFELKNTNTYVSYVCAGFRFAEIITGIFSDFDVEM